MKSELVLKNNLKNVRNNKNLSQEQLASLVGTTRQTVIAIEKGIFNPSVNLALLMSVALDCKDEELFFFEY